MNALEIEAAERRIRPYIHQTPVEHSPYLSQQTGAQVWLKLEHIQTTGSFKLRGAASKLLSLTPDQRKKGVTTASSGNHGLAVAYMAQKTGCHATVFLPETVAPAKVAALEAYEATLRFIGDDAILAERAARETADREGQVYISPYNDPAVIAGQGTLGIELLQQVPDMEAVLVPVGGGGLISGIGAYLKTHAPDTEVVGCQPRNSAIMYESLRAGHILDLPSLPTLSDGTAGGIETASLTLDYCQRFVDEILLVNEEEIQRALLLLLEKHYLMVEGAAALSVATLMKNAARFAGKTVVLILCGRKMGLDTLRTLIKVN